MKLLSYALCLLLLLTCLSGCNKETSMQTPTSTKAEQTDMVDNETSQNENKVQTETTTEKAFGLKESYTSKSETPSEKATEQNANERIEALKNSDVVTYYSENPNNKYICAVAHKYNVEKGCLVALIRTKAQNQGATVLQFSGKTDENGKLLTTKDELKCVYEVDDTNGTIKKASENPSENDGYSSAESKMVFMLTKQYILPELERVKKENVYPE